MWGISDFKVLASDPIELIPQSSHVVMVPKLESSCTYCSKHLRYINIWYHGIEGGGQWHALTTHGWKRSCSWNIGHLKLSCVRVRNDLTLCLQLGDFLLRNSLQLHLEAWERIMHSANAHCRKPASLLDNTFILLNHDQKHSNWIGICPKLEILSIAPTKRPN